VTDHTPEEIAALAANVKSGATHPMDVKMALAREIVAGFHGGEAAEKAAAEFQHVVRDRQAPEEVQTITVKNHGFGAFFSYRKDRDITTTKRLQVSSTGLEKWTRFLLELEQVFSASEAERIIKGGGFEVDSEIISDPSAKVDLNFPTTWRLKIGKRKFLRLVVE
jgi:tyrosyl-tRNA synthetase